MDDVEFLALLVHRGHVDRARAETLIPDLRDGVPLDALLESELGWSAQQVRKLRRTQAGEIPEIPGYAVLEKLGTGGTANVFKARDKSAKRLVALKVLKPEAAAHEPTRLAFVAEARMLERFDHPGIVGCMGVARSGETYFSRLELIEGATLLEILDRGSPFREDEALRMVLEVADALSYLEAHDVVHRDIKPGNIMLSTAREVKLIDLGFAAQPGAAAAASDSTVGTVAYLSPEQARGGAGADSRSDIYSLGVSLFHLVVGRLPFESSDDRETLRMQVMESLSSAELKSRGFSPHLHYFIEKMMAKDADHRYQSFMELIDDIRSQLVGRDDLDFERRARAGGGRPGGRRRGR